MTEIYKDIKGYEGIYQISNLGNVKRIDKKNQKCVVVKSYDNGIGYYRVPLCINNKQKKYLIHRLVAQAFINNPNEYPCVNHINGIKEDNRVENLEWCTQSHNVLHAFKTGLKNNQKGNESKKTKKIIDTKTGEIYPSTLTLSIKLGIKRNTLKSWLSNNRTNKTNYRYL